METKQVLFGMAMLLTLGSASAADALAGKTLFLNGPTGGGAACAGCHGANPANNVGGILVAANTPSRISAAIAANRGGMGILAGRFSATELEDIAAFIGNPTVTAAPVAGVSPASLTFSGTVQGQTSAALATTVSNTGTAALNLGTIALSGAAAGDFAISGGSCAAGASVAAGANCTVQLTFKPTAIGARAATLTVSHNGTGGASTVSLSGTGNAVAQATVGVSATSIDFGALVTNAASTPRTLTVSNSGQAALSFTSIALSGAQADVFTLGGTCAASTPVAPGASCTVTVTATPRAAGAFAGTLTLASNASNASVQIGLAGSGAAAAPALTASPTSVAFGAHTVGAAALVRSVSVVNSGNVTINFGAISVTGAAGVTVATGGTCTAPLAPAATCQVPLAFAPSSAGAVSATLSIASNAATLTVPVTGSGTTAAVAQPALSDSGAQAFADTQVGKASPARVTTLRNDGNAALKITTLSIGGANAADFALGGTCSTSTAVNQAASCTIETSFKPAAAGSRSAELLIVTEDGARFTLPLSGNGSAVAAPATLTLASQSVDFGAVNMNASGSGRVKLSNLSTAPLSLTAITVSGPFARVADASGCAAGTFVLQAGASCDLVLSYTPTAAGAATGSVTIDIEGGQRSTIALAGTGNPPPGAAPVQNQGGGGGCSSIQGGSDPMLALLVLLSLLVLGWRRATKQEGSKP